MSSSSNTYLPLTTTAEELADGDAAAALTSRKGLDAQDIACAYTLFLGRSGVDMPMEGFAGNLEPLLQEILHGAEFRNSVLSAILLREDLPHNTVCEAPPLKLLEWVQRHLPLQAATRLTVGVARTWTQLLELLLADRALVALAPYLADADVDHLLRQRLENEAWSKVKRWVIGVIDAASGFEMRGWAVDLCNKSVPVRLEFYADGLFLGSTLCSEPRPDVMDAVGGDGKSGFTFRISSTHRTSFAGGRTLMAIDSVSRAVVANGPIVYADAARH